MKMERKFFCKIKGEGCSHWPSVIVQMVQRNSAIFECYLSLRHYFYAPYGPFCSSSFDVRAWACNPNALFNGLVRNRVTDQHRQAITGKLCVFNKNWHRTCAVVTLIMRSSHPKCHKTHWKCGKVRSRDQWKTKYILFCETYGHKTWQGSDLWWGELIHLAN